MSISLTEDILSVMDLEQRPRELLQQLRETGRPIVLTNEGRAEFIMIDAATYERQIRTANLARLLAEAEADVAAGRTRPMEEVFAELRSRNEAISR